MVVSSPKNPGVLGLRAGATPQLLLSWSSGRPWEHLTGGPGQWLATVLSMMQVSTLLGLGLYDGGGVPTMRMLNPSGAREEKGHLLCCVPGEKRPRPPRPVLKHVRPADGTLQLLWGCYYT